MSASGLQNRLLYSSGVVNLALKDAAFGAFVLFYYKQVLGLSGTMTGVAIALSVVWDAISDPLVGAWSDRLCSRWGRRHPLMVASVIPLALSFIAVFAPPAFALETKTNLFLWLLCSVVVLRTALTFFMVPYLALGAEITTDYYERTRLASARTNMGWFVGVLLPASALMLLFTDDRGVDGKFIIENYHSYGVVSAVTVLIFSSICIVGTWHYIPTLAGKTKQGSTGMWHDIFQTFHNRNFRKLIILDTAIGGMGGIIGALMMVMYTYFWQLNTGQISILFAGPPLVAVLLVTGTSRYINERLEKHQLLQLSCALGALNLMWLTPMKLLGWLPNNISIVFGLIFMHSLLNAAMNISRTIANYALLADVADEQELATGQRQEGVMFAAAFFAAKFVTGFGYLVAGPFLDLIGLESGMQPGDAPQSVSWGLGLIMGPGLALLMLIPVWMASKLNLSLAEQLKVQKALAQRKKMT